MRQFSDAVIATVTIFTATSVNALVPHTTSTTDGSVDGNSTARRRAPRVLNEILAPVHLKHASQAPGVTIRHSARTRVEVAAAARSESTDASLVRVRAARSTTPRLLKDRFADVVNVKDYGTKGDWNTSTHTGTDDTAAFNAALAVAGSTTGRVYIPPGVYKLSDEIELPSGIVIEGASTGYNAGKTRIYQATAGKAAFVIGEGRWGITIRDLWLSGTDIFGTYAAGSYGIKIQGANPNSSYRMFFSNLQFTGWERAISAVSLAREWQIDGVLVQRCTFNENKFGIWLESQNADYWRIDASVIMGAFGGDGVRIAKGGNIHMTGTYGGGDVTGRFVAITGPIDGVLLESCQAESVAEFLAYDASAPDDFSHPLVLIGNMVDGPVFLRRNITYVGMGNTYNAPVNATGADVRIFSYGDVVVAGGGFVLSNNSRVVERSGVSAGGVPVAAKIVSVGERVALRYGPSIPVDASKGTEFVVTAADAAAFAIGSPTNATTGQRITIRVRNTSAGALGPVSWGRAYKLAGWTQPAAGTSRAIDFQFDGANWIEVSRAPADVPN